MNDLPKEMRHYMIQTPYRCKGCGHELTTIIFTSGNAFAVCNECLVCGIYREKMATTRDDIEELVKKWHTELPASYMASLALCPGIIEAVVVYGNLSEASTEPLPSHYRDCQTIEQVCSVAYDRHINLFNPTEVNG